MNKEKYVRKVLRHTIIPHYYCCMAGEQRPGGTRQLGHWLGDQLSSNTTPPIRITDMNT